jgi:GT2 family glycosyltransferase
MGTYEFDFCLRARDAGFSIATIPNGLMEDQKLGSVGGLPPWREYYNTRNHLWLGLKRRSAQIIFAFVVRELKFIAAIILYRNNKLKRLLFKYRAVRDALIGRRGKTYFPQESKG